MDLPIENANLSADISKGKRINLSYSDGSLKLGIVNTVGAINVYNESGYWESEIIDLSKFATELSGLIIDSTSAGGSSISAFTSTSTDMITFSAWEEIGVGGAIASSFAQYLKIRVEFSAGIDNQVNVLNTFNSNESSQFISDQYVVFDGNLKLKTVHPYTFANTGASENYIYAIDLHMDDFYKLDTFLLTI